MREAEGGSPQRRVREGGGATNERASPASSHWYAAVVPMAEGGGGGEAAEGPAGVGDGPVDRLVADAVRARDAGGVELGEDARGAVAEAADGRAERGAGRSGRW